MSKTPVYIPTVPRYNTTVKRERAKKDKPKPRWRFVVRYYKEQRAWVIDGAPGRQVLFATKMDAENHRIQKLGQAPAGYILKNSQKN